MNDLSTLPNMDQWVYHAHGRYVLNAERKALTQLLPQLFGDHLVQVGGPVQLDMLDSSLIRHRVRLTSEPSYGFEGSSVVSSLDEQLPFRPDSIDVMVMPHVLEHVAHPQLMIKAAFDVIAPDGHLLLIGFNPWGWWQLSKWCRPKDVLWRQARLHGVMRVCRWLRSAGFQVKKSKRLCFRPPVTSDKSLKKLLFLEPVGQLIWPAFGGVYLVVAQKRVVPLNPLLDKEFVPQASLINAAPAE